MASALRGGAEQQQGPGLGSMLGAVGGMVIRLVRWIAGCNDHMCVGLFGVWIDNRHAPHALCME